MCSLDLFRSRARLADWSPAISCWLKSSPGQKAPMSLWLKRWRIPKIKTRYTKMTFCSFKYLCLVCYVSLYKIPSFMPTELVGEVGWEGGWTQLWEEKCSEARQNNPGAHSGPQRKGERGEIHSSLNPFSFIGDHNSCSLWQTSHVCSLSILCYAIL